MSLDSNCRRGRDGLLPHYSPYSLEVVFAQPILMEHNVHVFPPFVFVGPLLRYFFDQSQHFAFTVIVPRLHPHHNCWAILQPMAVDSFLPGRKGDPAIWLSLPAPPQISLLGPYHGICGLFVVSAPRKLCIYACLYRLNAHGSLPADVPPALIQMTEKRTFAKLAINLCLVKQCKGPV